MNKTIEINNSKDLYYNLEIAVNKAEHELNILHKIPSAAKEVSLLQESLQIIRKWITTNNDIDEITSELKNVTERIFALHDKSNIKRKRKRVPSKYLLD